MEQSEVINLGLAIRITEYYSYQVLPPVWKADGIAIDAYHGFGDNETRFFDLATPIKLPDLISNGLSGTKILGFTAFPLQYKHSTFSQCKEIKALLPINPHSAP